MGEFDLLELLEGKKKDETKYFVTERRNGWIIEDSKGRSAIGMLKEI